MCQASFYPGQLALLEARNDDALRLFRLAAQRWLHRCRG